MELEQFFLLLTEIRNSDPVNPRVMALDSQGIVYTISAVTDETHTDDPTRDDPSITGTTVWLQLEEL